MVNLLCEGDGIINQKQVTTIFIRIFMEMWDAGLGDSKCHGMALATNKW